MHKKQYGNKLKCIPLSENTIGILHTKGHVRNRHLNKHAEQEVVNRSSTDVSNKF